MRIETVNCSNNCWRHTTENILLFHLFLFTHKVDPVEFDGTYEWFSAEGSAVT